jgi:RecA-family ATPase
LYIISGDAKLGKSTFCLHIAHCIATQAKAVLGSTDLYVEKDGRVLILDLEQELSDSVPRARAMGALSERLDVLDADTWERKLEEYSAQFDADTLVRMLITAWCARHNDRALVIVDNLSLIQPEFKFNKDRSIQEREWITKYNALAKKYGIAILLVEHNNKATAHDTVYTSSSRMRGSAQKGATPNGGTFMLERTRGDMEQAKGEIRLSMKVRSTKERTLYIKRDETLGHHTLSIALEGLSPSDYEKIRKETHKKVIDQLEQAVVAPKDIALKTGLGRSTVQKALDELEQAGYVKKVKHGIYALNVQKLRPQEAEQRALVDTLDT